MLLVFEANSATSLRCSTFKAKENKITVQKHTLYTQDGHSHSDRKVKAGNRGDHHPVKRAWAALDTPKGSSNEMTKI